MVLELVELKFAIGEERFITPPSLPPAPAVPQR
jgi:hypothetical protein